MKREVKTLIEESKAKWGGYASLLSYRLLNLCTDAEPAAMLSFTVEVEDEDLPLEKVAQVYLPREDQFEIVPTTNDYIFTISKGIKEAHPEFDITVKDPEEGDDDDQLKHIICTVPPVNKDRHDTLIEGVKVACDETKTKMDATYEELKVRLNIALVGVSNDESDAAKKEMKEVYDSYHQYVEQQKASKVKDIDDAYERYQQQKTKQLKQQKEEEDANSKMAGKSIRLTDNGEDEY